MEGKLGPSLYNVVKDQEYRGGIRVGLTFNREVILYLVNLHKIVRISKEIKKIISK